MTHADVADRVFNLLSAEDQKITNMSVEEATAIVTRGDPHEVARIRGSFALMGRDGIRVRMARTLDRPMRFFLAKRADGPALVVSDRIDRLRTWLETEGLGDQFQPSYTRMVPAHHVMEVEMRGCPDPFPAARRFFTPEREVLPPDLDTIGRLYVGALRDELSAWVDELDPREPIGVAFSGGIDSGAVLLVLHHVLASRKLNPQRLKAFTLAVDGGGEDLAQAREFLHGVGLSLYLEPIEVSSDRLDARRTVQLIEDYKPLDVQAATMLLALVEGIRQRYPEWKQLVDGDGGDENLKDYPIEENPELTIRSVLNNLMLYQEGWGVGSLKHSLTYSGGQSRSYVRTWAPLKALGFAGFSPYTRPQVIAVAEGIPFIQLTEWSVPALYSLKGAIVSRGVKEVTGLEMPIFGKRRFQHGAIESDGFRRLFSEEESLYRRYLDEVSG